MTYRQLTTLVKAALRKARKAYRSLDTKLEQYERELDRLIERKTLVEPKSLSTLSKLWAEARALNNSAEKTLIDAIATSST